MTDHPRTMLLADAGEIERLIEQAVARALDERLPAPDERPWLTRKEMADALGVSVETVTRRAAVGEIEKRGRKFRRK